MPPAPPQYVAAPHPPRPPQNGYNVGKDTPGVEMHLALPDHLTGSLIGTRGSGVKRIQESCYPEQVYISFAKPEEAQECPDGGGLLRPVTVRGTIRACMKAQGELLQSLQTHAHIHNEPVVFRSTTILGPRSEPAQVEPPAAAPVEDKQV